MVCTVQSKKYQKITILHSVSFFLIILFSYLNLILMFCRPVSCNLVVFLFFFFFVKINLSSLNKNVGTFIFKT